jgi:copper chaperone CopZ
MKTIQLNIPNMKSPHCQMTVSAIVKNLGASVTKMAPGQAEIELPQRVSTETIVEAIEKAGYKIRSN